MYIKVILIYEQTGAKYAGQNKDEATDVLFEKSKLWVYCDNKYQLSSQKVSNT